MTTTPFAISTDVESAWRPLTGEELAVVDFYLTYISAVIRSKVPGVDDRIIAGTLDATLAKSIAVAAVLRYLRNPEGKRQEQIEDYSYTRDSALSAGMLYLTDEELILLGRRSRRAFSITPSQEPADLGALALVASLQRQWRYWPVAVFADGAEPREY